MWIPWGNGLPRAAAGMPEVDVGGREGEVDEETKKLEEVS